MTTPQNSSALAASARWSWTSAGISASSMAIAALSWSAVGIASLELWQRLTWSFGWTFRPSPRRVAARWATTSFMFVLVDVPDPVW